MTSHLSIGLDIGGTHARGALVELTTPATGPPANIRSERRCRIREDTSPGAVAHAVSELVRTCCQDAGVQAETLDAIGIGIAGQLSADRRVVINGPNLGWQQVEFANLVEATLGDIPTTICNDLSGIAWGEYQLGGGQGHDDLFVVYVGTGVGSGLILNGRLYEGSRSKAGEIGHSKIHWGGRMGGNGEQGSIEAYIGGRYLELRVNEDLNRGDAEDLRDFLEMPREPYAQPRVMPSQVDRAAAAGVPYAEQLWTEVSRGFGQVMSACLALLNPSGWMLGGGVMEACPHLRQRAIEASAALTVRPLWDDLTVLTPTLGDHAGLLGSALLALEQSGHLTP